MSKTFVLIHGTWHGGWAWQGVVHWLASKGHRAHAPTLAGHGLDATRLGITHRDCVSSVVNYIRERSLSDIILVGHSFGGTVVQKVAEQVTDRIRRTVFLNAIILNDQQCVFDLLPQVFLDALEPNGNGHPATSSSDEAMPILVPAPWETWRDNFIQDAPESLARSTWEQLSAEPNQVNLDHLDLKLFTRSRSPRASSFVAKTVRCRPVTFTPECRRVLDHTDWSRWMAATRSCLRARLNWPAK